ncbi:hypothetical protein A9762_20685 [Pandoraea sp. ISTKB]|nr:hypothetical protein A9762_20685 [Pandoraea sp. ISTKB]
MPEAKKLETISVPLTYPIDINGVKVDVLTMRRPKVRDTRAAQQTSGGDDGEYEIHLFAALIGGAPSDLDALDMEDYDALQNAFRRFRSVRREANGGRGEDVRQASGAGAGGES